MNINIDLISEINSLKIKIADNRFNRDNLYILLLQQKSIKIIDYILNNIKITDIKIIKIPEFNIDNVSITLLKQVKNLNIYDNKIQNILNYLKQDNISEEKKKEIIESNDDKLNIILYELLFINNDNDVKNIIEYYSQDIISKYIPLNIQIEIIKKLKFNLKFNVYLNDKKLKFNFFMKDQTYNALDITIIIVKAFYLIVLYNIDKVNIKLNYYLTTFKKEMPHNKKFLGVNEINSGFTNINTNESEITIYRKEECEKLTIHEMVHALKIDNYLFESDNIIEKQLKCNFNISKFNKINFFESFTESIATISNCIINSLLTNIEINDLINLEIKFNILQCSKIMKFYKTNPKNFLCKNCCFKSNKNWIEKTSITAYFFCKLGIIYNVNNFIKKWMFNENIIIEDIYKEILENLMTIKFINDFKISDKLYNTLRMTINEFNWNNIKI